MKAFIIRIIILLVCPFFTFSQTHKMLSVRDICGTYYMVIFENFWTAEANEKERERFNRFRYLVIDENYYSIGHYIERRPYWGKAKKYDNGDVGEERDYTCSEAFGYFLEYPRNFDTVITTIGYFWMIEVIDYDTLIILFNNSYVLYKRTK